MRKNGLKHTIILATSLTLLAFSAERVQADEIMAPDAQVTDTMANAATAAATAAADPEVVDPYDLATAGQLYADEATPAEPRWVSGEMHAHTLQSGDASEQYMQLENVLNAAFREDVAEIPAEGQPSLEYGEAFGYQMTADHLRNSPRNVDGEAELTPTWKVIDQQVTAFNELKAEGKYEGKIYYPGFEWDMFGLDHASVAMIEAGTNRVPIDGIREFEWLYSYDTSTAVFDGNEEALFGPRDNVKQDKANSFDGLAWLEANYPDSILLVNHPSRHNGGSGVVSVEDLRKMQDTAPSVVLGFEGMPGNQMGGDRGEMTDVYGGADVMIAEVGGVWDSLLGEGRAFYNYANSDFHFKVSSNRLYSSGYWPSEYSRNYTFVEGNTFEDIAKGLKSGNSFSTYGDLISALEFEVSQADKSAVMGGTLTADKNTEALMTIRFKESENNNYRPITPQTTDVINSTSVDHIDLIMGEILGTVTDPTIAHNPTTTVVARFDKADWGEPDENGFYTIQTPIQIDKDKYYRLRGTNLGLDVPGETDANGNPLLDVKLSKPRQADFATEAEYRAALEGYFNAVNDRNYRDLWFYSNPIFVYAEAISEVEQPDAETPAEEPTAPIEEVEEGVEAPSDKPAEDQGQAAEQPGHGPEEQAAKGGQPEGSVKAEAAKSPVSHAQAGQKHGQAQHGIAKATATAAELPNTGLKQSGLGSILGVALTVLGGALTAFKKKKA